MPKIENWSRADEKCRNHHNGALGWENDETGELVCVTLVEEDGYYAKGYEDGEPHKLPDKGDIAYAPTKNRIRSEVTDILEDNPDGYF